MSPFQMILLALFGSSAVAGILIFAFFVGGGNQNTVGSVLVWGTFDEGAFNAVLRTLSDADSRLKAITYVQKNPETYEKELTEALASNIGPDLFVMRTDHTIVDQPKVLTIPFDTISREQFQNLFIEGMNPYLTQAGVIAVPFAIDPYVMYWNRDMFATAGVAKPPVFWDEMFTASRAITKKTDSGQIQRSALAFGEYRNVTHAKDLLSMLMLQAGSPITARDATNRLNPAMVTPTQVDVAQAAESALQFYTDFANPSKDYYSWNRSMKESRTAFADGTLAIYMGLSSEDPIIRALNPNLNFAVAPMPQIRNAQKSVVGGVGYAFAIPRASKNAQGAFTTAFLLGSNEASEVFAAAFGLVPARREAIANVTGCYDCMAAGGTTCVDASQRQCAAAYGTISGNRYMIAKQALIVRTWEDPHPIETTDIFRDMIEGVTSGSAKLTEAVLRAEQAMRQFVPL